jgi:hypothetical protein
MKNTIFTVFAFLFLCNPGVAQSSWKSPRYQPQKYQKVMVLAKLTNETDKRHLEDDAVKLLNDKGITAIQAYLDFTDKDFATDGNFSAKIDSLGIDSWIVFELTGNNTQSSNAPAFNMNVGVPVHIGIFGAFIGTNVPLGGGPKTTTMVNASVSFYNRSSNDLQWSLPLSEKLSIGADKLSQHFARTTIKTMIKDQVFVQ